ncbi:regulatory protein LuxR [Candidatus Protofrankia californiensis]|uniref:Regulatory protein LuxR n=1 Tax=Candidatus Protofrankia californiensis TaxID=1839754 RepID=A0A1C3NU28_9ACTN|nr:regulatory protein LuxR [Candidatus Protofrankia californiensis]
MHPEVPLEQLLRQQHDQLIRRQEELIRARMQVSTLVADYMQGRRTGPSVDVACLESAKAVEEQLLDLVASAERELLVLYARPEQMPIMTAGFTQAVLQALDRGVVVRGICPRPTHGDDATAVCDAVCTHGLELRVTDAPLADITMVDREVVLLLPTPGPGEEHACALLLREPALTNLVMMLFDQLWKTAQPLERDGELDQAELDQAELQHAGLDHAVFGGTVLNGTTHSPTSHNSVDQKIDISNTNEQHSNNSYPNDSERLLLQLLSLGAKDEAAARHLGVSVRTVRRMIADLMRRMDARSRFQAGILAAERGWL